MQTSPCSRCHKRKRLNHGYCKLCVQAYRAEYYQKNKARLKLATAKWRRENLEVARARSRAKCRLAKLRAIEAYGGKCKCCGESRIEFLSIDHINGGGRKHRLTVAGPGAQFYNWLRSNKFPKGEFRVLCCNCNQSIGLYGYCPHKSKSVFPISVAAAAEAVKTRRRSTSKLLTVNGKTKTVLEWSKISGHGPACIYSRLKLGLSPERAVFSPKSDPRSRSNSAVNTWT